MLGASWMLVCGQECAGLLGTYKPAAYDILSPPRPPPVTAIQICGPEQVLQGMVRRAMVWCW